MVIAIVLRLLGLVEPFVFQTIIDRVLPFQREATLALIAIVLTLTTLSSALLAALAAYLGNHMANRLILELAGRIFRHVLNLPLINLQRWPAGETLARIGEIDTVRSFLTGTIASAILDALFALIYIGALLAISPFLTLVVLITLPLQGLAFGVVGPFLRKRMQDAFLASSHHQSRLVEAFGSITTVKAMASEEQQVHRFQETLGTSLEASFRVTKLDILNNFLGQLLGNAPSILIVFIGSQLVFRNEITLGELIAFYLLAGHVSGPMISLASVWESWQGLRIARLRLGDFLNTHVETDSRKAPLPQSSHVSLTLTGISFGYSPELSIIHKFSANIAPHLPTLIVGESGCGKSTLAKLLSGLYTPQEGRIEVNGNDLSQYDKHSVRRSIVYLPQEPVLFSGTILENLLLSKPDASQHEIDCALFDSASDEIIARLPDGLHTEVGERGSYLSGGQRQRIALARALLGNPSALILDEPTSALDTQAAGHIAETLKRLAKEKTLVIVTHKSDLLGEGVHIINLSTSQRQERQEMTAV